MTSLVPTALPEGIAIYHHLSNPHNEGKTFSCMTDPWPCDVCGTEHAANASHLHVRHHHRYLQGVCSERCAMQAVAELNLEEVPA